jgi:hypothetical protein
MRIERNKITFDDTIFEIVPNTITIGNDSFSVITTSIDGVGAEWFTIHLSHHHNLRAGDVMSCKGRRGVSKVYLSRFMDDPPFDPLIKTPSKGEVRPPHCEDLKDISQGEYRIKIRNDGRLAVLTKI